MTVLPGDVLAVRGGGLAMTVVRLGAALTGKPNLSGHIAIVHHTDVNGTVWCLEGRPGGVGWAGAAGYLASRWTITNAAQPKTDAQRAAVAKAAEAMIGTKYDWDAIVADAAEDLCLDVVWLPDHGTVHGEVVCSALAAYAYDKAGLLRPAGAERLVQPASWDSWIVTRGWEVK